ncbi:ABC transporter substrate-binding protein [Legionella jordanis]|uniref:Amino acid ABC transporter substrate-binding protein n=1 Tax=Legionella jordanis TaxID=456 RepID=A0A0W0VET0_9GAMM|nr:ABC transporter substrate-binding protein [Legionella jordanis]KTD18638.1 amino acid ABC transporter substrate-binding protein [Legionella jordanis]RMX00852.1 amino acid ABC transporter substrate-binding protein [Legionella jordanis]VEH11514.1 amino acid ABC transporter substrate-binding protein [Legionella jordanis]
MKPFVITILLSSSLLLMGCNDEKNEQVIHFGIAAEYPPFEYQKGNQLKGFDVDLANLIAAHLGKKAEFDNMQFSTILPALSSGKVDAAISTITITKERSNNFDFSNPYYFEEMATVFRNESPVLDLKHLKDKKTACQLGSTMEIWLKNHIPGENIVSLDNNNQAIEALKAGHVEAVLMDAPQAALFSQKNPRLLYAIIAHSEDGYGIALKKGSPLSAKINRALNTLKANGKLEELKNKWLVGVK